jgi:HAD superfamily hydrolase (TIGR01509 family)
MLDTRKVRAISLDLDDTLWPIWPTIERAEKALHEWLVRHAPAAAALFSNPAALREIRNQVADERPELKHDMSAVRRESILLALQRAGDDPRLADPAFEAFFAARQQVDLYDDVRPALQALSRRFPLVSLSNGNADLGRVGLAAYFKAAVSAREFGVGKPDARIFHAAASAVAVMPDEVLHVGDDATLDVVGALDAGMQAVWINREEHAWPYDQQPHATVRTLTQLCELLA